MTAEVFVGRDVSQTQLDVAVRPGFGFQVAHNEAGMVNAPSDESAEPV